MTEVVTSSAATPQLNLLASRQQVFVVERPQNTAAQAAAIDSSVASDAPDQTVATSHFEIQVSSASQTAASAPQPAPTDGPSRPRIDIRSFDLGLTPSEVVGTPDVLARFDQNGDGHIDMDEADHAAETRAKGSTYTGVAAVSPPLDAPAHHFAAPVSPLAQTQGSPAADAPKFYTTDGSVPGTPKKFYTDDQAAAEAAQGAPSGLADAPKKFYGEGAEVVVGAAIGTGDAPKTHKFAPPPPPVAGAQTSGAEQARQRVVAAVTDQSSQAPDDDGKLYEKAQYVALAVNGGKKTVIVEVTAYTRNTTSNHTNKKIVTA